MILVFVDSDDPRNGRFLGEARIAFGDFARDPIEGIDRGGGIERIALCSLSVEIALRWWSCSRASSAIRFKICSMSADRGLNLLLPLLVQCHHSPYVEEGMMVWLRYRI